MRYSKTVGHFDLQIMKQFMVKGLQTVKITTKENIDEEYNLLTYMYMYMETLRQPRSGKKGVKTCQDNESL